MMIILFMFVPFFLVSGQPRSDGNPYFDEKQQKVRFEDTQKNGVPCPRRRSLNENSAAYGPAVVPSLKYRSTHSLEEEKARNIGLLLQATTTVQPVAVPPENADKSAYPDPKQQFQELLNPNMYNQQPQQPAMFPDINNQQAPSMFPEQQVQQPQQMFSNMFNDQHPFPYFDQNQQQPQPMVPDISNQQQHFPTPESNKQLQPIYPDGFSQQQQPMFPDQNMQQLQPNMPNSPNLQQQPTYPEHNKQQVPPSIYPDTFNTQQQATFQDLNKQAPPAVPDTLSPQQVSMMPELSQPKSVFPQANNQQQQSSAPEMSQLLHDSPTNHGGDTFYQNLPGYLFPEKNPGPPHMFPVKDIRPLQEKPQEFSEYKSIKPTIPGTNFNEMISPNRQQTQIPYYETNNQQAQFPDVDQAAQKVLRSGNIPESGPESGSNTPETTDKVDEHGDNAYLHVNDARFGLNADEISNYLGFHRSADTLNSPPNQNSKPGQTYMNELTVGLRDNRPLHDDPHCISEHDFDPSPDVRRSLDVESSQENNNEDKVQESKEKVEPNQSNENKTSEEIANTRRQLLEPTKGLDVYRMPDTRSTILEGSRICYACSTVTDPTCWRPDRRTTVKYCRQGHRACVTRRYKSVSSKGAESIVVRDCSSYCEESLTTIHSEFKYASCSTCQNDLCNVHPVENGAFSYNSINVAFILILTGLVKYTL